MKKATDALAAEQEAAALEGILTPTTEQMRLLRRYKQLAKRADEIKVEQEAIKASLIKFLDDENAKSLTVNGKNWVLISDTHRTVFDSEGFETAHPTLSTQYAEAVRAFTQRVEVPRGRVTIKPL